MRYGRNVRMVSNGTFGYETLIGYRYNGVDRPDRGLINGCVYFAEDIREAGWFRPMEIKINGKWRMWASFTEISVSKEEIKLLKRDSRISDVLLSDEI